MRKLSLIVLLLSGCALPSRQVKVIHSKSEISIRNISIDDGDILVCDPDGCRVLRK